MRLSAVIYAIAMVFPGISVRGCAQSADIDLRQNWDQKSAERFWFTSQGSQIMPYDWFLALEQQLGNNPLGRGSRLPAEVIRAPASRLSVPGPAARATWSGARWE